MFFYGDRHLGQCPDIFIRQRKTPSFGWSCIDDLSGGQVAGIGIDHLDGFLAKVAAQNSGFPGRQGRLVNIEFIRVHGALNDTFPKPIRSGDKDDIIEARFSVESKEHAA